MSEFACQFGEQRSLTGIVAEPPGPRLPLACILINAGLVPKHGPYRLYTLLCRHLAEHGFVALRFDLGGIGDSRPMCAGITLRERTTREIRAAVDHISDRYGPSGVVVGGMCSGAEDALRYAAADPRVTGVILIDPFSHRTRGWRRRHYAHQAAKVLLWMSGLYRPLPGRSEAGRPEAGRPEAGAGPVVEYRYMDRAESSQILRALIRRRVHLHFIYTGGVRSTFNHRGQLRKMFPDLDLDGLVTVDHFPELEHTQKFEEDRRRLVQAIGARVRAMARQQEPPGARPLRSVPG